MLIFNADEFRKAKQDQDRRAYNLAIKVAKSIPDQYDDIPYNKREHYPSTQIHYFREAKLRGF